MKIIYQQKEWDFVSSEITSSNKGGTAKGYMLFNFQILLHALSIARSIKERQALSVIYQKQKKQYLEK